MDRDKQIEEMWNIIITDCNEECVGCEFENDDWCFTHRAINNLYNAGYRKQSEGEWISDDKNNKTCSICGKEPLYTAGGTSFATTFYRVKSKFCPNCGAKMKGGADNGQT
jgi:ribosomal protein S27AE